MFQMSSRSYRKAVQFVFLSVLVLVAAYITAAAEATAAASPEVSKAAAAYVNALALGDNTQAWNLLSSASRAQIPAAEWQSAFGKTQALSKPPATALLRALVSSGEANMVKDTLIRPAEAFIEVSGNAKVTQQLVLVRESGEWRVDLSASDKLNLPQAGQLFLDAVREESAMSQSRGAQRIAPEANLALLQLVLAPQAKDFIVSDTIMEKDRAQVTIAAAVPISLVLRAYRSGAGWMVDMARPLMPVDPNAPEPLKQAVAISDRTTCEEQLRQLGKAIQMYAASSADMLPDPAHWVGQIRPHLPPAVSLHCPTDAGEGISYAMNANLKDKRRGQIANPGQTVLLFESGLHNKQPSDTGASWAIPNRHPEGNLVLFADGSVRPVPQKLSFAVAEGAPEAPKVSPTPRVARPQGPVPMPMPR